MKEKVEQFLAQFETADAFADYCRAQGIKRGPGVRSTSCPVAVAIQRLTGEPCWVATYELVGRHRTDDHFPITIDSPAPIQQFVRAFDDGHYPDLTWPA